MIVDISSDAEDDLIHGYWFYERQSIGLGDYFRSCLIADIESLSSTGGFMKLTSDSIEHSRSGFRSVSTIMSAGITSPLWLSWTQGAIRCGFDSGWCSPKARTTRCIGHA